MKHPIHRIAIIYRQPASDLYLDYVDETSYETGCGGIESFMINTAREFALSPSYHVYVYCHCKELHDVESEDIKGMLTYIPDTNFETDAGKIKFEHIIINRDACNIMPVIYKTDCCRSVFLQAHDVVMKNTGGMNVNDLLKNDDGRIRKVVCVSEGHRQTVAWLNRIPYEFTDYIPQGLNPEDFKDISVNHSIDHSILWDSAFNRQPEILINLIAPIVRREIPDFKIEMCSYLEEETISKFRNIDYVHVLPRLTHTELIKKLASHAVWYHPGTFLENFCISMVEAAACGDEIVMDLKNYSTGTVMRPFLGNITLHGKWINDSNCNSKEQKVNSDFIMESASRIIDAICHYHEKGRIELRKEIRNYVLGRYTWQRTVEKYKQLFNSKK